MSDSNWALPAASHAAPPVLPPSDYTPMLYMLAAVQVAATIVALFAASRAARSVKSPTLRSFVRLLPLAVSASFAPLGTRGSWGPALWGLLLGPPVDKAISLASIAAYAIALLALCALIHRVARRAA
jgi:hypothetical protein